MEKYKRYILLFFTAVTLVVIYVLDRFFIAALSWAEINNTQVVGSQLPLSRLLAILFSVATAVTLYRHPQINALSYEISAELEKVTWPSRKETQLGAYVVVIMVLIMAGVLGFFDFFSSYITGFVR
ncbi:MAG: hypothetical protein Kow0090_20170 [Myxococcota bacterium]